MGGSEGFRRFVNLQYIKLKRTAPVGALLMLVLNLAFSIYPYMRFRGVHPYVAIPLLFVGIFLLIWFMSHVYVKKLEMYRTEALADKIYNPYMVYAIGPFEEMKYRNMDIPILEAVYNLLPSGEYKDSVLKQLNRVKHWCDLGYIPKDEFPKHLKKYYITDRENRL